MTVIVSHPGRQYSHELAQALHGARQLYEYWTGIPATEQALLAPNGPLRRYLNRYGLLELPQERVVHCYLASIPSKMAAVFLPAGAAVTLMHRADGWYDAWAAARLARRGREGVRAIVCYENAALRQFATARRLGIRTILDAASVHYAEQARVTTFPGSPAALRRIEKRKASEIQLADDIIVCSELARDTYIAAGVAPSRVTAVPLGVDLAMFSGNPRPRVLAPNIKFVFAGTASDRKGLDVLLTACELLVRSGARFQLTVAGALGPGVTLPTREYLTNVGRLRQQELAALYAESDVLVLPSRHESFGMVVVEALAAGMLAIVSDRVGAKEAIQEGRTGWVVPVADAGALAACMGHAITNRQHLEALRGEATKAAAAYTWDMYHRRVVAHIKGITGDTSQ